MAVFKGKNHVYHLKYYFTSLLSLFVHSQKKKKILLTVVIVTL